MAPPRARPGVTGRWPRLRAALRRGGTALFLIASFGFLGAALLRERQQLLAHDWQIRPLLLAASLVALMAALAGGAAVWGLVLRRFGVRVPFPAVARIWFLSSLGRYIPGKIWQFVGVAGLGRAAALDPAVAVTSLMVHTGFVILSAWLVGIYLLPPSMVGELADVLPALRIASPFLLVVLSPAALNAVLRWGGRLVRRPLAPWRGSWGSALLLLGASVLQWLALGAAFHLFVGSLTPVPGGGYPALTAAFSLAFLAGYAVVIAPAGLGAKEGALAALLSTAVPLPVAAAVAVGSRVWTIAAELLPALVLLRGPGARAAVVREGGP